MENSGRSNVGDRIYPEVILSPFPITNPDYGIEKGPFYDRYVCVSKKFMLG